MQRLPGSLSIAFWPERFRAKWTPVRVKKTRQTKILVGALWIVGVIAWLRGAPGELVMAALVVGLIAGCLELSAENRRVGR
jgi:hypothetical protein